MKIELFNLRKKLFQIFATHHCSRDTFFKDDS